MINNNDKTLQLTPEHLTATGQTLQQVYERIAPSNNQVSSLEPFFIVRAGTFNDDLIVNRNFVQVVDAFQGATVDRGNIQILGGIQSALGYVKNNNAVLVKDKTIDDIWYLYHQLNDGRWAKWHFLRPSTSYKKYICLGSCLVGECYKSKHIVPASGEFKTYDDSGVETEWSMSAYSGMNYIQTSTQNQYAIIEIPAWTDRIDVDIFANSGSSADMLFSWSDDTDDGLLETLVDVEGLAIYGAHTITIMNGSNNKKHRYLKIKHNTVANDNMRILGIRCSSLTEKAHPCESINGIAVGNDLLTVKNNSVNGYSLPVSDFSVELNANIDVSTTDLAISWGKAGESTDWTGGGGHMADFQYTYNDGEYINGPNVLVDGISVYDLCDTLNNPPGIVYRGSEIQIISEGYANGNWDSASESPEIRWQYTLSGYGIKIDCDIKFNSDTVVSEALLAMFPYSESNEYTPDELVIQDGSLHPMAIETDLENLGNYVLRYKEKNLQIGVGQTSPAEKIYWSDKGTYDKVYIRVDKDKLGGGIAPNSNQLWHLSGGYTINSII